MKFPIAGICRKKNNLEIVNRLLLDFLDGWLWPDWQIPETYIRNMPPKTAAGLCFLNDPRPSLK